MVLTSPLFYSFLCDLKRLEKEVKMGLLTKEIEVKLTAQNIERYEKLGYEIPRQYDALHKKNGCKKRNYNNC